MELHAVQLNDTPLIQALREAGIEDSRTRAKFALLIGVDSVTVWRWLKGRSHPNSHATREAVADALGRQPSELFPPNSPPAAAA